MARTNTKRAGSLPEWPASSTMASADLPRQEKRHQAEGAGNRRQHVSFIVTNDGAFIEHKQGKQDD